jgi:S-DNA-T family DNA segregation ATPase FtsK/SpoIIIE
MTEQPEAQPRQRFHIRLIKAAIEAASEGKGDLELDEDTEPGAGTDEPGNLPAVPDQQAVDEPLEGTIIDAATARDIIEGHQPTRALVKQAGYVVYGVPEAIHRIWLASSTVRYRQFMNAAYEVGDHETGLKWADRIEGARKQRHKRFMELVELPAKILGHLPKAALGLGILLVVVGLALAWSDHDIKQFLTPWRTVAHLVRLLVTIVKVLLVPALITAAIAIVLALRKFGRTRGDLPAWLATGDQSEIDIPIDESTIAQALDNLRIPQISNYLKQGHPLQFIVPCRQEGRGTGFQVRLPGVPAEMVAKRRAQVAAGLYRRAQEVWIATGSEAGIMVGWAADKGALAEGAGPYPLLDKGLVNVFDGVPYGRTLRGDPLLAPIIGRNTIIAGQPEQGKSAGARTLMLGCALDPTAEQVILVPDSNFDFQAFEPRCSVYVMGAEDDKIEQICLTLEALLDEIQWRGDLLVKYQQEQVTRELAAAGVGLHPKLVLLEEAHRAFGHPDFGARISVAWETGVRLCRKRAIHMIASTQATTGPSGIPPGVTINCSNGIAYALARWQENDAVLGQGAYSAGHRATDLIPGEDRGNAVVKGFTGERSVVAQAYYVSPSRGRDQVTPIIERAMAAIAKRGRGVPGAERPRLRAVQERDLLDDLDEALGDTTELVRISHLPALLCRLAPNWMPYRGLKGKQLEAQLKAAGVRITNTGNVPRLDPADLRAVINRRATEDLDEE